MTDEPTLRRQICRARSAKAREARDRATALNAPLREPPPNEVVKSALAAATKQRNNAAIAVGKKRKSDFLANARRYEDAATKARTKQLEEHWAAMANTETVALAEGRGMVLESTETVVQSWAMDERGVLVRNRQGDPVLVELKAKARRRKPGLEWLRDKGRITQHQFEVGETYHAICVEAAKAEQPGRVDEGQPKSPLSKAPTGLAEWKTDAVAAKRKADAALTKFLPRAEGEAMLWLCENVLHRGESIRDLAGGQEWEQAQLEERLKMGLAILRVRFLIAAKEEAEERRKRQDWDRKSPQSDGDR